MEYGIRDSLLPSDGAEVVDDAAEVGAEGIELDVRDPDEALVLSSDGRNRVRERVAATGIDVPSLCIGWLNRGALVADDDARRRRARETIERSVDAAASLGAGAVLVPFFGDGTPETDGEYDRAVEGLRSVAPVAETAGVTLALETPLSGEEDVELCEAVDSPAVGVYYDSANPLAYGHDPVEDLRTTGEHLARVHGKDRDADGNNAMLGDGEVDFDGVRSALEDLSYDGWVVLETPGGDDMLGNARENLSRVRELIY